MKKIFMMCMALMMSLVINAQTAIETPKIMDNWYLGVGGQVSTPLDFNGVFPLNGSAAVTLGKELTPIFGVNVEDNVWFSSHANGGTQARFDNYFSHNIVRGNYLGVNGTINLTNLLCGYMGAPRKFELQTVTGLGWWHVFTPNASDRTRDDLGARTGLNFLFNLGNKKAHTIYVQPAVLWNLETPGSKHDDIAFNKMGAQLAVQVGYVYHFKTSNGTHYFKTYDVGAMQDEINRLRAELEKKPTEVIRNHYIEKVVEKTVDGNNDYVVFFAFDSDVLTDDAKATLDKVKGTVCVIATASPEGTAEYNKALSQRRADVVKAYLEARGVTVEKAEGLGVQGDSSGRVSVVTVK